jgi:hypothetical protein
VVSETSSLVGINSAHWHPNVLALRRMIEELTALALFIVGLVTGQTIVHPGPLYARMR